LRVLVTGGAGAIGSFVVDTLLARGDRVAVLDSFHEFYPRAVKERNLARARAHSGFAGLYALDIRDAAGVARAFAEVAPEGVVHLAARAGVGPSLSDPVGYADVNLLGTAVVLNAAATARVERLVFASSSSVYGERPRGAFREDMETDRPISPYAATKRGGELLCHAAHASTGLPITCLRFFTVYGPRQRPDLSIHKFARCIAADEPIPLMGDGSAERDFTYVADTVDGVVRALDRARDFRIYNLGRGKPVTMNETIAALERALGRKARRQQLPPMPGNVPRTWASIERARAELGYEPKVDLDHGLAEFARWLREEGECAFS
jgi:UDP-glucuronate 4-epimerase